jgi:RNA polymerase sigma-70 factor, ECF subfamily
MADRASFLFAPSGPRGNLLASTNRISSMSDLPEAAPGDLTGDADAAVRQLHARYARALYGYVERFSPDLASADDIVQETFIRAWRHLPHLAADDRMVRPWLFRVARNLLIDASRAARSRPVTVAADDDLDLAHDDESSQVMDRELLAGALRRLSPAHRTVLVETYYRGGTTATVARRLGIPHGTARSRLHYALRALRQQLQDPPESPSEPAVGPPPESPPGSPRPGQAAA